MKKTSRLFVFFLGIILSVTGICFAEGYSYVGDTNAAGDADILKPEFVNCSDYASYLPNSKFIAYAKKNFQKPVKDAGLPLVEGFYVKSHDVGRRNAASWQAPDFVRANMIAKGKKNADGTRYMYNCTITAVSDPGNTNFKILDRDSGIDVANKHVIAADGTDLTQKAIMDQQAVQSQQDAANQERLQQEAADKKGRPAEEPAAAPQEVQPEIPQLKW